MRIGEHLCTSNLVIWNGSSENGGFIGKMSIYSTKIYEGSDKPPRQEIATFLNTLTSEQYSASAAGELINIKLREIHLLQIVAGVMDLRRQTIDLASNPKHTRWLSPLLLLADAVFCAFIIWKIPCELWSPALLRQRQRKLFCPGRDAWS